MQELVSASEAARRLGVHKSTITRACDAHGLGVTVNTGANILIALSPKDVDQLRALVHAKPRAAAPAPAPARKPRKKPAPRGRK